LEKVKEGQLVSVETETGHSVTGTVTDTRASKVDSVVISNGLLYAISYNSTGPYLLRGTRREELAGDSVSSLGQIKSVSIEFTK
jgi:hypothetical protein